MIVDNVDEHRRLSHGTWWCPRCYIGGYYFSAAELASFYVYRAATYLIHRTMSYYFRVYGRRLEDEDQPMADSRALESQSGRRLAVTIANMKSAVKAQSSQKVADSWCNCWTSTWVGNYVSSGKWAEVEAIGRNVRGADGVQEFLDHIQSSSRRRRLLDVNTEYESK